MNYPEELFYIYIYFITNTAPNEIIKVTDITSSNSIQLIYVKIKLEIERELLSKKRKNSD